MMSVFNKRREFVRFILVGVLATATHYGIYFFLCVLMLPAIAYTIGYAISFILNFTCLIYSPLILSVLLGKE